MKKNNNIVTNYVPVNNIHPHVIPVKSIELLVPFVIDFESIDDKHERRAVKALVAETITIYADYIDAMKCNKPVSVVSAIVDDIIDNLYELTDAPDRLINIIAIATGNMKHAYNFDDVFTLNIDALRSVASGNVSMTTYDKGGLLVRKENTVALKETFYDVFNKCIHLEESYFRGFIINKLFSKKLSTGEYAGMKFAEILHLCYVDNFTAKKGYKASGNNKFERTIFEAFRACFFEKYVTIVKR